MKRLPIRGFRLVALERDEGELKHYLAELGAAAAFDDSAIHDLHIKLAAIHGRWLAERTAKEVSPVVKALGNLADDLTEVTMFLSGHDTGMHSAAVVETASQIVRALEHNGAVDSVEAAHDLINTFKGEAAKVQRACLTALADLTAPSSQKGRDALGWYDEFAAVLLGIAKKIGVEPALGKDRITGERSGWLFQAARALEPFFPSYMRSQSPEACGKRLERSRKRLLKTHRQKRSSG
jgi:hypothetical protein